MGIMYVEVELIEVLSPAQRPGTASAEAHQQNARIHRAQEACCAIPDNGMRLLRASCPQSVDRQTHAPCINAHHLRGKGGRHTFRRSLALSETVLLSFLESSSTFFVRIACHTCRCKEHHATSIEQAAWQGSCLMGHSAVLAPSAWLAGPCVSPRTATGQMM